MIGSDAFDPLPQKSVVMMQRFLSYGGFILFDDVSGTHNSPFSISVRRLSKRLFPTKSLTPLRADHAIYRSYFWIERPLGRVDSVDYIEGIHVGKVTPLMLFHNDLSGALDHTESGIERYPVIPGGTTQRTEAVKLFINIVMYALTSNYKHDSEHVKKLIEEGRLNEMDF